MTKQLTGPQSSRRAQEEQYLANFATLPEEEKRLHFRIVLNFLAAVLRGSKTPLIDAVAGESDEVQTRWLNSAAIDADYKVADDE